MFEGVAGLAITPTFDMHLRQIFTKFSSPGVGAFCNIEKLCHTMCQTFYP